MATLFLPQVIAQHSAIPDVPPIRLGRFAVIPRADRADAVRAGDVFRLHADSVHAQYPRELDEAARSTDATSCRALVLVLVPMLWPAMVSAGLFQFVVVEQRLHGPAALRQLAGALSGDAVCAHEHGRGYRLCVEPRHGRFPDFHYPVAGCVLPRAEAVHERRDGRRRQGLISLLLFFGGCQANKNDILRAKLSIWARKVSRAMRQQAP